MIIKILMWIGENCQTNEGLHNTSCSATAPMVVGTRSTS